MYGMRKHAWVNHFHVHVKRATCQIWMPPKFPASDPAAVPYTKSHHSDEHLLSGFVHVLCLDLTRPLFVTKVCQAPVAFYRT